MGFVQCLPSLEIWISPGFGEDKLLDGQRENPAAPGDFQSLLNWGLAEESPGIGIILSQIPR